ncbi:MAG: hypothetical protein K8L97_07095 [Anaerolineae bacterium]|nr:hypothetical protein [Anaerolineae bacterium]
MGKRPFGILVLMCLLAACASGRANTGPQLVQDVPLELTTPAPTRILTATPSPIVIPVSTSQLISPLQGVTLEASFVLITPTLPPSKTPTLTPTQTGTFTRTPPSTFTPDPLLAPPISGLPPGVVPIPTAIIANPPVAVGSCSVNWFFSNPVPTVCPLNPPLVSAGSFQQFQNGVMLWVGQQDAIYVLYDSTTYPRWQVFNDTYTEGVPDTDPAFDNAPPSTWQPRRGFGLLWRSQSTARDRLGWSIVELEMPFTTQVQIGSDGVIYLLEPRGGVYALMPDASDWKRYESF